MDVAVVPTKDPGAVFLAKVDLALANHCPALPGRNLIYHISITAIFRLSTRLLAIVLLQVGIDLVAGERPVVVEIGDHVLHVSRGERDGALPVTEMVE